MVFYKEKCCFIITPIGANGSAIRRKIEGVIEEVIEPMLNELGYEMKVSHRINDSGSMTNAIIKGVYESDLVIANLTGNNPNVMYEVALRHASVKPIIHITENIGELPFDINDQRTIEYIDDMAGASKLKIDLKNMIQNIKLYVPVENPVTCALEKRDLVNVPEGTSSKDFSEILYQIKDDMQQLKKDVSLLKDRKRKENLTNYLSNASGYISSRKLNAGISSDDIILARAISEQAEKINAGKEYMMQYLEGEK